MALSDNLTCYFSLNEASGDAIDAHGSSDLDDFGTTGSATGKVGNARDFEAGDSDVLALINATELDLGSDDDFCFTLWVQFESLGAYRILVCRSTPDVAAANDDFAYRIYYDVASDRLKFTVGNSSSSAEATANNLGAPSTGTWYFIVAWHDKTANTINIKVNNGTVDSTSWSGGTQACGALSYFRLGSQPTTLWHDGLLDEVGFWKGRYLTDDEQTELYNNGNGRDYNYIINGNPIVRFISNLFSGQIFKSRIFSSLFGKK